MADKIIFEVVATAKGVKVVQQQTDKLAASTDKAERSTKKLDKSRDVYNRREKGAAQISSNTTKNFSKMQQGIDGGGGSGGLVRAYALLAANVFALTAAFGVLSRSAEIDTLTQSMEVLSTTGGTYIKSLAKEMQAASGFAIDLAQGFRQVSLASSAGLSTKEIEGLTTVAKGAAISLGRNLPDAMDRIFRGAIKLEPEILDEIGLFVRVDEAAQKYARNNGKVVSALTQVEKRQAFLNEILEQGTRKFQEYADEIKPDPYTRLGAALMDIAQGGLSLVNKVFGPLLNFLAESKGVLTAVFGVLVFSLIKKAIPALGQFNMNLAENARTAADNARDYNKSVQDTTAKQLAEDNKKLQSTKDRLEKERALTGRGKGRAGQSAAAIAANKALKTEMDGEKRLVQLKIKENELEKQIKRSKGEQQKLLKQDLADMRIELRNLQEQEKLTKRIADNEARGRVDPKKGHLMQRRQEQLDTRASSTTIIAGAAGVAEHSGIKAGFKELDRSITNTDKNLGTFGKTTTYAKGAVSILGTGIQRLMMILGPWMMVLSLASPILISIGKAMGFGSEETKKLDKELSKLTDQFENLSKRFNAQVKGMDDINSTYREQLKASVAFNKNQVETIESVIELEESFKQWQKSAGLFQLWWEGTASWFGFGREAAKEAKVLEASRESLLALAMAGDTALVQMYTDAGVATAEFSKEIEKQKIAQEEVVAIEEKHKKVLDKLSPSRQDALDYAVQYAANNALNTNYIFDEVNKLKELDPVLGAVAEARAKEVSAREKAAFFLKRSNLDEEKAAEIMRNQLPFLKQRTAALQNMQSAIDGAQESIGKFNQAMMPKTKVDDVLGSFNSIISKYEELAAIDPTQITGFFEGFADIDNPLKGLFKDFFTEVGTGEFNTEGQEIMKSVLKDSVTPEVIKEALKTVQTEFKEYRVTIIKAKAELKALKQEEKDYKIIAAAGRGANAKQQQAITGQAEKEFEVQEKLTNITLRNIGYERDVFKEKVKQFNQITDEKKQEEFLTANKLTRIDILAVEGQMLEENIKRRNKAIAAATEEFRIDKQVAEESLKLLKTENELTKAIQTRAELTRKLASSRVGGEVRAIDTVQLELKAAKDAFEFEVESVKLKKDILEAEHEILKARMKVIFLEAGMAKKIHGKIVLDSEAQGFMDTIAEGFASKQSALGVGLQNAALRFGIATTEAIGNSFKAGSGSGILGAIRGAAAGVAATGEDGMIDTGMKDAEGNAIRVEGLTAEDAAVQVLKSSYQELIETMGELGPAGKVVAGIAQGSMTILTGYENMIAGNKAIDAAVADTTNNFSENDRAMAQAANTAEMAASALSGIGQMMAANSAGQVAEIDQQINAEKRRDGKSKESLAKIAQLEKKKEAMQRKAFEQNKKVQMAVTIANTAASIMAALSAPPIGLGPALGMPMAVMAAAMGALQLAVISKTKYQGGGSSVEKPSMQKLSVGKRDNTVDVSRGASGGELAYMRGRRGVGSNANDFRPTGGAYGMKNYAHSGEGILVGEQGPEVVTPTQPVDVTPMTSGGAQNVNFTINAVDAEGVEAVLERQRGNIIGMIRNAANGYGQNFLEQVDTDIVSDAGYQKA